MTLLLLLRSSPIPGGPPIPPGVQLQAQLVPRTGYRRQQKAITWTATWGDLSQSSILPPGAQVDDTPPRSARRAASLSDTPYNLTVWLDQATAGAGAPPGVQLTDPPPRAAPRARDYSWSASSPPLYTAGEVAPVGAQFTELPPKAPPRSRDYTWQSSAPVPNLIGQDAMATGVQSTALPPRAPARLRDYTWTWSSPPLYLAGEVAPMGVQSFELPPKGRPRGADLSTPYNLTVWLDFAAAQIPQVLSAEELPPRAKPRLRDYTHLHLADLQLVGQDAMVTGVQLTPEPPRGYRRAASLYDPLANQTIIPDFLGQQVPPPGKSTRDTELPPRGAARSRDYTFLHPADTQLFGQDAMVTGQQLTGNAPRGYQRAATLSDPGTNFTLIPDFVQNQGQVPGQSTRSTELPPRGAPRNRDYTFLHAADVGLIGQDALPTGQGTGRTELPPRGPARSKDYTWLQSMPLHVYQQLPVGQSTLEQERPPRGPLRLKDYTFLHLSDVQLIGQDRMYGAPGQVPTYDWPNPIPYKRPLNYRMFVNPAVLFTGKPFLPGTVVAGSTITDTVLAGTSATGSMLGGTSLVGTVLSGPSQTEV